MTEIDIFHIIPHPIIKTREMSGSVRQCLNGGLHFERSSEIKLRSLIFLFVVFLFTIDNMAQGGRTFKDKAPINKKPSAPHSKAKREGSRRVGGVPSNAKGSSRLSKHTIPGDKSHDRVCILIS